jgi:hypothetical protein
MSEVKTDPLIGRFFHSLNEDGFVVHQGVVHQALGNGHYLCHLMAWETDILAEIIVHVSRMAAEEWRFYERPKAMTEALEIGAVQRPPEPSSRPDSVKSTRQARVIRE